MKKRNIKDILLGAVLTVFSGVRYLVKNKHVLADTAKDGKDGGSESAGAAVAETADAAPSADANEAEK